MKQIYALLGGNSRKVVYVGVTGNLQQRLSQHWRARNSTYRSPVKDWLSTLAEPPEHHVFEEVCDDLAKDAERYYTQIIRVINPELLNVLDGQEKRPETRRKTSNTMQGIGHSQDRVDKMRNSLRGRQVSDEHRQHLGDSLRGKPWSEKRRQAENERKTRRNNNQITRNGEGNSG